MRSTKRLLAGLFALFAPALASAQGTLPIALQQQFAFTNCATFANACGTPLSGGLLYFFQVGTVATPQQSFQDPGLTLLNPNPLTLDANGRIPNFYLANGAIHVRLTDSAGVVQFEIPNMLVIGPSSGGGGGGSVDPTTIAATGDIKFRPTSEFVTGWVKLNGQTIGSATSGASQRANADTQALFIYLWQNCADVACPVTGGRGVSGLADFNANKQLKLLDMRGRNFVGLDDMGNSPAGVINSFNMTAGNTTTPTSLGGEANHTLIVGEMPVHGHAVNIIDPGHPHDIEFRKTDGVTWVDITTSPNPGIAGSDAEGGGTPGGSGNAHFGPLRGKVATTGITATTNNTGGGTPHQTMGPFMLGTFFQKL